MMIRKSRGEHGCVSPLNHYIMSVENYRNLMR